MLLPEPPELTPSLPVGSGLSVLCPIPPAPGLWPVGLAVPDGVPDGTPDGVPDAVPDGVPDGVLDGVLDGVPDARRDDGLALGPAEFVGKFPGGGGKTALGTFEGGSADGITISGLGWNDIDGTMIEHLL